MTFITRLKEVKENADSYGKVARELVEAYNLYDSSIDTIVEVWKEMLNSSDNLKKIFNLLIMTEFVDTIWNDENIKIVIEEILTHTSDLSAYDKEVVQLVEISEKLDKIVQDYKNNQNSKANEEESSEDGYSTQDTNEEEPQKDAKKKAKAKNKGKNKKHKNRGHGKKHSGGQQKLVIVA